MTTHASDPGTLPAQGARPAAPPWLWTGLASSAVVTVAALLDQLVTGSLRGRLAEVYTPYDVPWQAAGALLTTVLIGTGVLGMAGWLWTARGAARGRRWAAPVGTVLLVLGLGAALTVLTAGEYGQTLVPAWLGLLSLLPGVVGLVATAQLWRDRRRGR